MEERKIKEFFSGKKITLMGLGLLGRGVGDAEFLAQNDADLLVTDLKTETELENSLKRLKKYENIKYRLGEHREEDFKNVDLIIKSAGIPLDSLFIKISKDNKIPVKMSTALFASLSGARIIGITGTRGKSTTAQMIYEILKKADKNAILGGNIKGVSTLSMLPEVDEKTIAVLELDSWQLQGFGELGISPSISIFTNFYPDHLNYYKGDMDLYFADKANIFRFQKEDDVLIMGEQALLEMKKREYLSSSKIIEIKQNDFLENIELKIKGEHNKENVALAVSATREIGVSEGVIKNTLEKFDGLEGRMQKIAEINGHAIYNDTNSTTPEATSVALKTLGEKEKVILIAGGSDKDLNMEKMSEAINKYCEFVCFLKDSGTERFLAEFDIEVPFEVFDSLEKALNKALIIGSHCDPIYAVFDSEGRAPQAQTRREQGRSACTERSRSIILSPGFASFGMFKNEFDRGEQFNKLVKEL